MRTDVLVVGGGIVGQVAAIELARGGADVTLIDAGRNAGSTANAGSLHVQMQSRFIRLYPDQARNVERALPFYRQAAAYWVALQEDLGSVDLVRKGGLMLAEDATQMAFLDEKARREAAQGLDVELLDRGQLDRIAPWLGPQVVGAELCRDEGKLNPLKANVALDTACDGIGVRRVAGAVTHLEAGSAIVATTNAASVAADQVIVAAAWGSGVLVERFGVSIPTTAEPLHMNITEACDQKIEHLVQHAERSITLKQFRTGQVVIGGGWPAEDYGPDRVPGVLAASVVGNVSLAARLVPAIGGLRIVRTWAGMNTTADGSSIIGRLPDEQRIIMAVPGDAGYTLGPLVGRMAADIALERDPAADPGPYTPARFAS